MGLIIKGPLSKGFPHHFPDEVPDEVCVSKRPKIPTLPKTNMDTKNDGFLNMYLLSNMAFYTPTKIHPRNLTQIPKIASFKGSYLFQTIILGIHVSFRECNYRKSHLFLVDIIKTTPSVN